MADISEWWVVEYSPEQNAFNVTTVADALHSNLQVLYGAHERSPFVTLAICETQDEAREVCFRHMSWRNAKERRQDASDS